MMKRIWNGTWRFAGYASFAGLVLAASSGGPVRAQSRAQGVELAVNTEPSEVGSGVSIASGEIRGVTRDGNGIVPIGGVQVLIHSLSDKSDRTVISDANGSFVASGIPAGRYEVSAEKSGFVDSMPATLDLSPAQ